MRVLVTQQIPEPGLEQLRNAGAQVRISAGLTPADVSDCDVLVSLLTERVDRQILTAGRNLLGVAQFAVGYNNIDVEAATELGIPVTNTPDVLTDTTADATWAMLLAVARQVPQAHAYTVGGHFQEWNPGLFLGADVSPGGSGRRKVLGVVGYGRIGQAVGRRSLGFDMDVLAYSPRRRKEILADELATWTDLPELLERSDFVSLHTPLTAETRYLIGETELRTMKPSAFLVNAARGPVVNEQALVQALREGWIAGAALDVYEDEPTLAPGLAELSNVVLLPHIGSASVDTRVKMSTMAAENALAHLRRERAPNCINPEVYDSQTYSLRQFELSATRQQRPGSD